MKICRWSYLVEQLTTHLVRVLTLVTLALAAGAGATAAADGRGVCLTAAGVIKASTNAPRSAGATLTAAAQVTLVAVTHTTLVGAVATALL